MNLEILQSKLNSYRPGTFIKIRWSRDIASAKARKEGVSIIKECEGLVRVGINYRNLAAVKSRSTSDEPKKPSWFQHYYKGIVENKADTSKKYLQVFTVPGHKIKSKLSVKMSLESLYQLGYITKADLSSNDELLAFTLSLENINSFGE